MSASRAVDMEALQGYTELLRKAGHEATIITMEVVEMKAQSLKATKHIFAQCHRSESIENDAHFNEYVVDMSDIWDDENYYGGLFIVPYVARQYCYFGRLTSVADAAHLDGVGSQPYGTAFEVVTSDTNHHLLPLVLAHFVGPEWYEKWKPVFEECRKIRGLTCRTEQIT